MISIDRLNDRQIYELFGDPKDAGPKKYIVKTATPFPLYMAGRVIKSVEINKYIIESWLDALEEIRDTYGPDLHKLGLDEFGGCYNIRATKGNTAFLSRHAWGLAVDHLMTLGPYGRRDILPYHFVMAFLKRGWDWGGHWPEMYPGCTVLDGMHFSVGG